MIYLASQSPRRRQLLDQLGIVHELLLPGANEDAEALEATQAGEAPVDYVQRVTRAKLDAAQQRRRQRGLRAAPILCADTTVALGQRILGKPADAVDALAMLRALSGEVHQVHTALAVAGASGEVHTAISSSKVWFADVPEAELLAYVASGEPLGKAGAYAIQGRIAAWIARIDGSHSGIMGLPLFETAALLRSVES
jgi:septum formation protein